MRTHPLPGAKAYWLQQRAANAVWAQGPDGWRWTVSGYNPSTQGDCATNYCPTLWAQVYFEGGLPVSTGMSDRVCQYLLEDLGSRFFFITGVNDATLAAGGAPVSPDVARIAIMCTQGGFGQVQFLPIIMPW